MISIAGVMAAFTGNFIIWAIEKENDRRTANLYPPDAPTDFVPTVKPGTFLRASYSELAKLIAGTFGEYFISAILYVECYFSVFLYIALVSMQTQKLLALPATILGLGSNVAVAIIIVVLEVLLLFVPPKHLSMMSPLGLAGIVVIYIVNIAIGLVTDGLPVTDGEKCPDIGAEGWEVGIAEHVWFTSLPSASIGLSSFLPVYAEPSASRA